MRVALCLCLLLLLASVPAFSAPTITSVVVGQKSIKLTFADKKKPEMRVFTLTQPDRLVIDFKSAVWRAKDPSLPKNSVIKGMRRANNTQETYRLVFDLVGPASVDAGYRPPVLTLSFFNIKPAAPLTRTVVKSEVPSPSPLSRPIQRESKDVAKEGLKSQKLPQNDEIQAQNQEPLPESLPDPVMLAQAELSKTQTQVSKVEEDEDVAPATKKTATSKNPIIIVLDPGHGGKDPGARGKRGTQEKDLVLKTARELADAFKKVNGYKVVMTRSGDTFVPLRGRIDIARASKADLFISLHADSAVNPNATGMSVYTLSERASDREAAKLANKENQSDIIAGVDLSGEPSDVSDILIDLVQRGTMNASADYASRLVTTLSSSIKMKYESHRFAGFVVLKAPDVPSILIEMGYLSNPKEEWLLVQKSHRDKLIQGIVQATQSYFRDHPKTPQHVSWQP